MLTSHSDQKPGALCPKGALSCSLGALCKALWGAALPFHSSGVRDLCSLPAEPLLSDTKDDTTTDQCDFPRLREVEQEYLFCAVTLLASY